MSARKTGGRGVGGVSSARPADQVVASSQRPLSGADSEPVKFPAMLLWAGWLAPGLTHQGWGLLCCNCLCAYNYSRVKSKTVCVHVCVYLGIRIYLDMCVCIWMCACIHGNVYRAGERRFTVVSMQSRVYSGISVY